MMTSRSSQEFVARLILNDTEKPSQKWSAISRHGYKYCSFIVDEPVSFLRWTGRGCQALLLRHSLWKKIHASRAVWVTFLFWRSIDFYSRLPLTQTLANSASQPKSVFSLDFRYTLKVIVHSSWTFLCYSFPHYSCTLRFDLYSNLFYFHSTSLFWNYIWLKCTLHEYQNIKHRFSLFPARDNQGTYLDHLLFPVICSQLPITADNSNSFSISFS